MVRQYDVNGSRSYALFRYGSNGSVETLTHLFAREENMDPSSADPCPYYEIDGIQIDQTAFYEQLDTLVTRRMLDRSVWTQL